MILNHWWWEDRRRFGNHTTMNDLYCHEWVSHRIWEGPSSQRDKNRKTCRLWAEMHSPLCHIYHDIVLQDFTFKIETHIWTRQYSLKKNLRLYCLFRRQHVCREFFYASLATMKIPCAAEIERMEWARLEWYRRRRVMRVAAQVMLI